MLSIILKFNLLVCGAKMLLRAAQGTDLVETIAVMSHFPRLRDLGFFPL